MRALITLIILAFSVQANAHKHYISIADMEYDEKENKINVSMKITAHDFEHILEKKFDKQIHIEKYHDSSDVMVYSIEYLIKNFKVYSDKTPCNLSFVGKEVTLREELFFYFSFENVKNPSTIKIVNTLLFSLSDQQQNIVHYKYKDRTKSVTLLPAQSEAHISFE
jgi:hypothetical protein